jgi:TPR repeat protein
VPKITIPAGAVLAMAAWACLVPVQAAAQQSPQSNSPQQYEVISSAAIRPPAILGVTESIAVDPTQSALYRTTVSLVEGLINQCRTGEATACMAVGDTVLDTTKPMVLEGESRPVVAAVYLEHACGLGLLDACTKAATVMADTASLKADTARFGGVLQRGCRLGGFSACSVYGAMYFEGAGGPPDAVTAIDFLARGCRGGDIAVCAGAAQLLVAGTDGLAADPVRGAGLYQAGCDGDDAVSCYNLAMMQVRGRGIPADEAAGIANLQRANTLDPDLAPAAQALRRRGLLP